MVEEIAEGPRRDPVVYTVRYTKEHCLASAWRFWQRRVGYRYALELVIGVGLLMLATQGPYRWLEIALMVAVGIFVPAGMVNVMAERLPDASTSLDRLV